MPTFNVLVVYEDLATGLAARQTLERSILASAGHSEVGLDFWRADLFREPEFAKHAAGHAPDLLFLSLRRRAQLPFAFSAWFREWAAGPRAESRALAILFEATVEVPSNFPAILQELESSAKLAHLEVFIGTAPASPSSRLGAQGDQGLFQNTGAQLVPAPSRTHLSQFRDWGINE